MKKWYLEYADFDNGENEIGSARRTERKGLKATEENAAIKEAENLWAIVSKETNNGWDKVAYPHSPKVVLVIPIAVR